MANTLQIRRSSVSLNVPTTAQLALGELAINTNDGKLFFKRDNGVQSIIEVASIGNIEPALGNPTTNGYVLSSTIAGVRSWVAQSGGGGLSNLDGGAASSIYPAGTAIDGGVA